MPVRTRPRDRALTRPGCTLARVTILDDARAGMNPDIRPQDDLFRHVNGRWLDTTDIPADRSAWGAFADPRRGVGGAGQGDHRGARRGHPRGRLERPEDRRPVHQLHGRGAHRGARRRAGPRRPRAGRGPRRRRPRSSSSSAASSGAAAPGSSAPTSTPTTATPTATSLNIAPGRHRAARRVLLPRGQVRRHPRRLPHPHGQGVRARRLARAGAGRPAGARRGDPAGAGPLGAGRDPRRHQGLQPDHPRGAPGAGADPAARRVGRGRSAPTTPCWPRRSSGSRPTSRTSRPRSTRSPSTTGRRGSRPG